MKRLAFFIEIESTNGCWWLLSVGGLNKGQAIVKFCDSYSLSFGVAAVWKTASKQVYGRQMFLRMLVAIWICRVTISPMLGSLLAI